MALAASAALTTGCIRRTISISTDPAGSMVWLNDREVGRSPIDVDFDYYGTYDVRVEQEGYEPLMTTGKAKAPLWDTVGLDLISELMPFTLHSRVEWHYALEPVKDDPEALVDRARDLRSHLSPAEAPDEPAPPPAETTEDAASP
jgi:hypothetical protein